MFRLRARVDKALQEDRDLSKLLVQEAANLASKSDHEYGNLLNKVIASRGTAASYIAEVRPELLDAEGLKHASKHDDAAQELVARYLTARENTDYADIDKKITAGFVTAILNNTNVAISTASTAPKTLIDTLKMQSTEDTEQDPSRFRFMRVTQELKPSTLELFMHTQEEAARYLAENHPEMLVHNSSLNVILQVMQYNKDFAVLFAESGIGTLKCANPLDVIRDYEYSTGEMITEYTKDPMRRRNAQLLIDVLIGNDELTQALIDKHPEFFEMFHDGKSDNLSRLIKGSKLYARALLNDLRLIQRSYNDQYPSSFCYSKGELIGRELLDLVFSTYEDLAKSVIDDATKPEAVRLEAIAIGSEKSEGLAHHCIQNHYNMFKDLINDKVLVKSHIFSAGVDRLLGVDAGFSYGKNALTKIIKNHAGVAIELARDHTEIFQDDMYDTTKVMKAGVLAHETFAIYLFEHRPDLLKGHPEALQCAFDSYPSLAQRAKTERPYLLDVRNSNGVSMGYLLAEREGVLRAAERI